MEKHKVGERVFLSEWKDVASQMKSGSAVRMPSKCYQRNQLGLRLELPVYALTLPEFEDEYGVGADHESMVAKGVKILSSIEIEDGTSQDLAVFREPGSFRRGVLYMDQGVIQDKTHLGAKANFRENEGTERFVKMQGDFQKTNVQALANSEEWTELPDREELEQLASALVHNNETREARAQKGVVAPSIVDLRRSDAWDRMLSAPAAPAAAAVSQGQPRRGSTPAVAVKRELSSTPVPARRVSAAAGGGVKRSAAATGGKRVKAEPGSGIVYGAFDAGDAATPAVEPGPRKKARADSVIDNLDGPESVPVIDIDGDQDDDDEGIPFRDRAVRLVLGRYKASKFAGVSPLVVSEHKSFHCIVGCNALWGGSSLFL